MITRADDELLDAEADVDADADVDAEAGADAEADAASADARPLIEHQFVVENECDGWRLDRFLMKRIRRLSRNRIQRVIRGDLDVDGAVVNRPAFTVHAGQIVTFRRPAPPEPDAPRLAPVVLADPCFYVIDKPAGLPMHPTARYHHSTLTSVLREKFPGEALRICHRLDRETSGLLLVARRPEAEVAIKKAFARRRVAKKYLALVWGRVEGEQVIDGPLGPAGGKVRVKMAVRADGLPSRTRVAALQHAPTPRGELTLVAAWPETGRQHQIRAHLDHIGHPIVGDKLYPDEEVFIEWVEQGLTDGLRDRLGLERHALHAAALAFPHPESGATVKVESPLPPELVAFLEGQQRLYARAASSSTITIASS